MSGYNKNIGLKKDLRKPFFTIQQGKVKEDFERLHSAGKPLLTTPEKYIVFCGLMELTDRACVHMELKNPTKNTILFNIRTPASPCFFVKPHVGMIEPNKTAKLFFSFKGRCHRVPSDYCWIYSIYHIVIDERSVMWIKEDEFSSSNLRTIWNEQGRGEIRNILHLSCRFDEQEKPKHECRKHTIERRLFLNDTGEVLNATTIEESRGERSKTPDLKRASSKKVSSSCDTTDELPKTASSEKN